MRNVIKRVPVPLSGVMLSFAAFGNFLKNTSQIVWIVMEVIAGLLLMLLLLKLILYPEMVRRDMRSPAVAGVAGTFSMGVMFFAVSLKSLSLPVAAIFWWAGLLLHAGLILYFTRTFLLHFQIRQVYMSWFLVYVGIVAAAATSPAFGMQPLGRVLTVYGLPATAVLMILMAVRYLRFPAEKPLQPLQAICAAPFSLCLVGYNQSFSVKNQMVLAVILFLSLVFYILGIVQVVRYIGGTFYPSFAGFTFPFVNTAIGTTLTWKAFRAGGSGGTGMTALSVLAAVQCVIAAVLLSVVFLRYAAFLLDGKVHDEVHEEQAETYSGRQADSRQKDHTDLAGI
ncbi:MAG: TDT family transporter [Eubacterium sp.]|nr:TDT family transporter [Eubacterium sp.]